MTQDSTSPRTDDPAPSRSRTDRRALLCILVAVLVMAFSLGTFLATGASFAVSGRWFAIAGTGGPPVGEVFPTIEALAWRGPALAVGAAFAAVVLVVGIRARVRHRPVPRAVSVLLAIAAIPVIATIVLTATLPDSVFLS